MSKTVIVIEKKGGIATITLNRPKVMNALSTELKTAIADTFNDLKKDASIGVAILTGAGRAFCAGLDLKELAAGGNLIDETRKKNKNRTNLIAPLKEFGRPIIGAINGPAVTGGLELAIVCDILIASTEARFADTHARMGIMPGSELSQKLSRVIGIYRAKEMSLTGNFIDAEKALAWGLVNRVVAPPDLLPTCQALASDILSSPRDMIQKYKKLIDDGFHLPLAEGLALEKETFAAHLESLTAETVGSRGRTVMERGRKQKSE
jgi:enoyl-CoA hydratase